MFAERKKKRLRNFRQLRRYIRKLEKANEILIDGYKSQLVSIVEASPSDPGADKIIEIINKAEGM